MQKKFITTAALMALATAAGAGAASAQETTVVWSGAVPEIRHGEASFRPRGRLQYDIQSNDWDVLGEDGERSYARRARLGVQGNFSRELRYILEFDFAPSSSSAAVTDAYIEYVGDGFTVLVGESKIAAPLEERTSSLVIPFIERSSIINAFEFGRRAGLGVTASGARWHWAAAIQGDSLNNSNTSVGDESTALSTRFTFVPLFETAPDGASLVHLGVHLRARDSGDDPAFRYRARPLNGRGTRWIDAGGALPGGEDLTYGAEAALQLGPFGAQGEYMMLDGETTGGVDYDFGGYYLDVYWSLTGESRNYRVNQGAFSAISPSNPVTEGGWGHWMVSGRYDFIDLSDPAGGAARGEQTAYAVGLDWIPLDNVRFKLNYAMSDMDRTVGADDEAQIVTLRTQFNF